MYRCFTVAVALLLIGGAGRHALAAGKPDVTAACAAEVGRFCPNLAGTPQPRNQRICLMPYRSSLSLGCRNALGAKS